MFTQPSHCCCVFSLRTGTIILALLDFIGYTLGVGFSSAWGLSDRTYGIVYSSIVVYAIFVLLSAMFLYGAIKRKHSIVQYFSVFIAIQIVYFVIERIAYIVHNATSTLPECTGQGKYTCRAKFSVVLAANLVSMFAFLLINLHFFFSVRGYARQLASGAVN